MPPKHKSSAIWQFRYHKEKPEEYVCMYVCIGKNIAQYIGFVGNGVALILRQNAAQTFRGTMQSQME